MRMHAPTAENGDLELRYHASLVWPRGEGHTEIAPRVQAATS